MKPVALGAACALITSVAIIACVGAEPSIPSGQSDFDAGLDAAAIADAGSVILRGEFESTNCLGWTDNGATMDSDPIARTGKSSCRICDPTNGTANPVWGIFQDVPSVPAGTYAARGFARTSGDAGPFEIWLGAQPLDGAGQSTGTAVERSLVIAPGEDWAPITLKLDVGPGQGATVSLLSRSAGGGCFLMDDVTLIKE